MKLSDVAPVAVLFENIQARIDYLNQNRAQAIEAAFSRDGSVLKPGSTSLEILAKLSEADPTANGSAITWIVSRYVANEFKLEDVARLKNDIGIFYQNLKKVENKDLNSYKSLNALYDVTEKLSDVPEEKSNKQVVNDIKTNEVQYLINSPSFKVLIPKTKQASCLYGAGTKWCTAAKEYNQFEEYNSQGPLMIIIAKQAGKDRKFQMHYESGSFMNGRDQSITKQEIDFLSTIPEYKDFLNMMIKKHYPALL